jgi:protein SCO1
MITFLQALLDQVAQASEPPRRPRRSDAFTNPCVTDQFGQPFQFKTDFVTDRSVIINTMFTVCRGSCPGTSATLQRLRSPLSQLLGKRVTLLSISLDPANDSPAALRDYAESYGAGTPATADQCDWHFLRCPEPHLDTLRRSLGFFNLDRKADADISRHGALLLFGNDATDRWATSPAQIRDGLIFEPLRRILGVTTEERFGLRL